MSSMFRDTKSNRRGLLSPKQRVCPHPNWISLQCILSEVLVTKSHRRHIMGLQQSLFPGKVKREVCVPENGQGFSRCQLCAVEWREGVRIWTSSSLWKSWCTTLWGQKATFKSFGVIEHRNFWLTLYAEIRHRSYGELGICNPGQ